MGTRAGLVECVDSLVGEVAVADVAVGEFYAGFQGFLRVCHTVVGLVFGLDVIEDRKCFFGGGRFYHHFLETAFEGTVFLDIDTIFIESSCANTLYFASCKSRFKHVGRVHRALRVACANDGVYLVNKENDVAVFC